MAGATRADPATVGHSMSAARRRTAPRPTPTRRSAARADAAVALAIALLVAAIYAPVVGHEFVNLDDHVYDEWLVRDQSAIVRQMGFDVVDWTRALIAREGGPARCVQPMTPANDVAGPYDGRGNDSEWGARYADIVGRIMAADLAVIPREYDRAVNLFYPGGQDSHGWSEADQFWMGLRAALQASLDIDVILNAGDSPEKAEFARIRSEQGVKAAIAWRDARFK